MGDDLEYLHKMLQEFQKLESASEEEQEFLDWLQVYQAAGWPFGGKTEGFLVWKTFGMETTVN